MVGVSAEQKLHEVAPTKRFKAMVAHRWVTCAQGGGVQLPQHDSCSRSTPCVERRQSEGAPGWLLMEGG